jgi:hypothetical protein
MATYQDYVIQRDQYVLRAHQEAKALGLAQEAATASGRRSLHCYALAWLGQRLVTWGRHLEERFSPPAPATAARP